MEKRYYIDGKCVLSYDDDVFSTDDDYTNIKELFIYPAVDKVYVKYYEKQLVQQVLEKTLKKNDSIFNTYCAIKELIKDEPISVDYVQSEEDTLLKNLMRKNLNSDEYVEFEDINIVGRQDYKIKKRKPVEQIINGMNQNKPVILLDHQPRSLEENKKLGIDLMISGHTHAGQVFPMLPLWNLLGINEMNYGYRHDDNFNAIVSSGMGTWGFAMRTSKNCEIVVIDLISK